MTVEKFIESAKQVEQLASKYLDKYADYFELTRLDCGNIEFDVNEYKKEELFNILPDDMTNFPLYLQFCFYDGEWHCCVSTLITNVGKYKKEIVEKRRAKR